VTTHVRKKRKEASISYIQGDKQHQQQRKLKKSQKKLDQITGKKGKTEKEQKLTLNVGKGAVKTVPYTQKRGCRPHGQKKKIIDLLKGMQEKGRGLAPERGGGRDVAGRREKHYRGTQDLQGPV